MGFYGSKLLGQNTTFKFDRIYPNRKTMEENRHTDGVYIGRYVLIDYGLDDDLNYPIAPEGILSRHFYLNPNSNSTEIYIYPNFETIDEKTGQKYYQLKFAESEDNFYEKIPMQEANNNLNQKYYQKNNNKYEEVFPPFYGDGDVFVLKEPVDSYILKDTVIYIYSEYNYVSTLDYTKDDFSKSKIYFYLPKDGTSTEYKYYTGNIPPTEEELTNINIYEGVGTKKIFYRCNGSDENGYATFEKLSNDGLNLDGQKHNYTKNYNIDLAAYTNNNGGKGYDSTVWQKVFKDGEEYYINIADLNTVIPTFDVTVDGPTLEPRPPHFDANSTNVYYNLHTQPSWGFRVKEAERKPLGDSYSRINDTNIYPSDLEVNVTDTNYWKDVNGKKQDDEGYPYPKYAGAVYFNKAGFDSEIRSDAVTNEKDNGIDNAIKVTPTGQSGQKYNTHDGIPFDKEIRPDIQELSIMLPGIGNTISELWDLAYGDAEANDNNKENKRNKNIEWDDTSGLRLVNKKSQDNNNNNGFTFSTEKVNNLAGCINSVHDLMGMIVQTVNDTEDANKWNNELENADYGKIYYRQSDGNYYIKSPSYKYEELEKDDTDSYVLPQERKFVEVKVSDFKEGEYYLKQNEDYILQDVYTPNTTYYDMSDIEPKELNSKNWKKGIYYYQENNSKDFKKDEAEEISKRQKTLYDLDNLQYHILYDEQSIPSKTYPVGILDSDWYTDRENIKWYIKKDPNDENYIEVKEEDVTTDGITVYEIEIKDEEDSEESIKINGASLSGKIADIKDETYFLVKPYEAGYTYYYVDKNGYYYKEDILETNITLLKDNNNVSIWKSNYKIIGLPTANINPELDFYEPGIYHYKENNNYYLDYRAEGLVTNENKIDYYLIDDKGKALNKYFYEPNKYYYKDFNSNSYYLDTNNFDEETTYYLESTIHVTSDNDLLLPLYSVWNPNATGVPSGVQLSRKVIDSEGPGSFKWTKLEGFSRTLNTIHGLIVRINHLLQFTDNETRENFSVMGCINQMHDIINSFADLVPEQFAIIDNYGRIQSAEIITDDWLDVQIDGDPEAPKVDFKHEYHPVSDEPTESDKNGNLVTEKPGLNNDISDDLLLYTSIVDDMGHVIGKNIETVTLPYGFKEVNNIIAESTKDKLTIEGDNNWINVSNDNEEKILVTHKYFHNEGKVPEADTNAINLNETEDNSFSITLPNFDDTGHIEFFNEKEITLPNSFKTVNGIVADSTQGILNIDGNDWISLSENIDTNTLTINHKDYGLTSEDTLVPSVSLEGGLLIPYATADSAGHVSEIQNGEILFTGDNYININNVDGALNFSHNTPEGIDIVTINSVTPEITEENMLSIPLVNIDEYGHVTGTSSRNVQLPSATTNSYQNITVVSSGEDPVTLSPTGTSDSLRILGGKGITLTAAEARNNFPASITISSDGNGLTIDSQLTDYISDEYTDIYYPDVEIGEDFNGNPVPIPADIQSTDTLGRTFHRLMTWIQVLNRRVLELEGHTMSGNVMG